MGSLPNLHELGKDAENGPSPYRPGPALGHLCSGGNSTLSQAEKSKILHRYSGHARITKARSNGNDSKIVCDDFMLEHMATYSPISNRSTRNLTHNIRRRDSLNSSIGATSVRRLIAVVRSNTHHNTQTRQGPPYSRRLLLSNLVVLCITHLIITAAFLPFLALQTSVSVWTMPLGHYFKPININIGSILLAIVHFFAAMSSIFGPSIVQKLGTNVVFFCSYLVFVVFYASHLYPSLYVLIPVAILLGLALGPLVSSQITFLMTLSAKINYMFSEEDDDSKALRRTCIIRRLARAFQAAHDFGLIVGSVLSALLITYTVNINNQEYGDIFDNSTSVMDKNQTESCSNLTLEINCTRDKNSLSYNIYDYNAFLDDIFDTFEGTRLCGAQACPPNFLLHFNMSEESYFHVLPKKSSTVLAVVYAGLCFVAAMASAVGLDRIRIYVYQDPLERPEGLAALRAVKESFKDVRLQMAAPLALFIGLEQAFIYADFSKSYVVCTLGIHRLNLVFLSMGLLQSIAACTLSMLLRTIRRYYVVAVGFTFHACLLMVLILWKPIEDDPALFYVISAAWGVCNAIWEMLNFTLLTGLYSDNWESAFANSAFFRFLGLSIAFAFHGVLCNYYKLYALGFFLLTAVVPFVWLEVRLENMRKVKNIIRL
ncbi:UNC93-like protein [Tribolium madens]|uniref:UNC93-like protein n=1 Tax=Tribolium madens TaxID=41895 RepID=UPI001CF75830|nr:UNC93-like protein [Tribolium madens]